jgi:hypothetical protein
MDQQREWQVSIPSEGVAFSAICSRLGENQYRLDSIPGFVESLEYGDIFEAEQSGDELRFINIVSRGGRCNYSFLLTTSAREGPALRAVLTRVEQLGGVWEQIFGGTLCISMPANVEYDPTADVLATS